MPETMNAAALTNILRALQVKIAALNEELEAAEKELKILKELLRKRSKCQACDGAGVSIRRPKKGERIVRKICSVCNGTGEPVPK